MSDEVFAPKDGAKTKIAVGASTGRVEVYKGTPGSWQAFLVSNLGTAAVWIRAGDATVVATSSDLGIPAGVVQTLRFRIPATGALNIAAIAAGSTGDIEFVPGEGM